MNLTLHSYPLEITSVSSEKLRGKNACFVSKSSIKARDLASKQKRQVYKSRKVVVSCHSAPESSDGLAYTKISTEGANRRLEFVRTLLIDNYDSYTYNIYQELSVINGGMLLLGITTTYISNYLTKFRYNNFCKVGGNYLHVTVLVPPVVVSNDELTWEEIRHYLYEERAFDNIVISPGPGSPACPSDIGESKIVYYCLLLLQDNLVDDV